MAESFRQLGNETIRFLLVKTTWPDTPEKPAHFQLIATLRELSLEDIRQAIQDDFDEHSAEEHPDRPMLVEVFDADQLPKGAMSKDAEATSTQEVVDLARAIAESRA